MNGDALLAGSIAPDFSLPDQDGRIHMLSDYREHWVFLYFYPHDNIARCTREACVLRDHFPEFQKLGVKILGISADSPSNHKICAEKNAIPFPLLADTHRKVARQYGATVSEHIPGENGEETSQVSFLVNPVGGIEKIYRHVKPETHAREVLTDLATLQGEDRDEIEL